jgi:AsmA family protein
MHDKVHTGRWGWKVAGVILLAAVVSFGLLLTSALPSDYVQKKALGWGQSRLGRDVSLEGPLTINWDWFTPHIRAKKLRIANMPGMRDPYMLDISQIDFTLRLWPLLRGRLEIPQLHIQNPQMFLEKKTAQLKNWDFPPASEATAVKKAVVPEERSDFPILGVIRVNGGKIVYKDHPRDLDMTLHVDTVKGKGEEDESFALKGEGVLEEQKFTLKAAGGSLELLRDTNKEFPLAFEIDVAQTIFSLDGTFTDPVQLQGLDATLNLQGRNLADLFYLLHIPFPPTPAYNLKGHLEKQGDQWTFTKFSGRVGNSDLSGTVVYNTENERPLLTGNLFSKRMDVADLGGLIGMSPAKNSQGNKKGGILPDVPINLKRLRAGDMDLNLTAAKLHAPGWPLSDMKTHISLKNGLLVLKPLQFGVADGVVKGFIQMNGRKAVPQVKMDVILRGLSLRRFFTGTHFEAFSKGYFGGQVVMEGPGSSLKQVLGKSDGHIVLILAGGKISRLLIEAADIDIAELMPLLLGKDKTTDIRCGIADFNARDGQLKSELFLLDTTDTNLQGKVEVDLERETIDASLDAHPKDISLLSLQSKILLKGKLNKPTIMIDPVSTGLRGLGAVALGTIAPVAALLPFIELGGGRDADCNQLILDAQGSSKQSAR